MATCVATSDEAIRPGNAFTLDCFAPLAMTGRVVIARRRQHSCRWRSNRTRVARMDNGELKMENEDKKDVVGRHCETAAT
ncbi:MAG: hypothetical protein LBT00_12110 [Spirochaetaceae bacterium]|nr:hypothetical protein [Spirochaetaceae bacterium]